MRGLRRSRLIRIAWAALLGTAAWGQQPDPGSAPLSTSPPPPTTEQKRLYRDLDLLRRGGFAEADQATVSLRIADRSGLTPLDLTLSDFQLIVNGSARVARLHAPGTETSAPPPMVLLVLPPNQPIVHSIAVKRAEKYFAAQPAEVLPWNVGIFDSNGKMTAYTNGRTQLLANLDAVEHAPEPFQMASYAGLRPEDRWDGPWLSKAQDQVAMMQKFAGPKVVLAINPLSSSDFGLNRQMFAQDGPLALVDVAERIGAHIYIANVGGPEVILPGGEINASHDRLPSYHMQVDPAMNAALAKAAANTSGMMQAASDTLGGFSNSLDELAGKIHRDLDGVYTLEFDLTPADTDKGVPVVQVKLVKPERKSLRLAVLDVEPVVPASDAEAEVGARALLAALRKTSAQPVNSSNFRISQHVDYFPLRGGLEPLLPMTASVEWVGRGLPPRRISLVEDVENPDMANLVLERAVEARWDGRSLSWERDGRLTPGNYIWRVAVVDGSAAGPGRKILSSSQESVRVGFPRHEDVASSTLIVGKSCRAGSSSSGLQRRPVPGAKPADQARATIDPMQAADCRVKPEADAAFAPSDTLRAFLRIYPVERLEKRGPGAWTAHFVLIAGATPEQARGRGGAAGSSSSSGAPTGLVEAEADVPFTVDSGSGYLASIAVPLSGASIRPGPHTLIATVRGAGVRGILEQKRAVAIDSQRPTALGNDAGAAETGMGKLTPP